MELFLEKFEANYYNFMFDNIAEAKFRVITEHEDKVFHLKLYENDSLETVAECEETGEVFFFNKQLNYQNSEVLLNALEKALRNML